jgi:PUA domain protein
VIIVLYCMIRFTSAESVSGITQAKTSVHRNIRKSILESYPGFETYIESLLPKKTPLYQAKCAGHINLIVVNKQVLFFQMRDQQWLPTLQILHKFPDLLPKVQVDRGAIKFVLKGADIMCPGLTSKGGKLDEPVEKNKPVAIYAEGKEHALAIGFTKLSTEEIKTLNKDIALENLHFLNDGLWTIGEVDV